MERGRGPVEPSSKLLLHKGCSSEREREKGTNVALALVHMVPSRVRCIIEGSSSSATDISLPFFLCTISSRFCDLSPTQPRLTSFTSWLSLSFFLHFTNQTRGQHTHALAHAQTSDVFEKSIFFSLSGIRSSPDVKFSIAN